MDVKRKFLSVLTEIFGCCIKAEKLYLFTANTFALVKIFALCYFSLLTDVERRDRTMVTHHAGPDFARSSFAVFNPVFL